jgi:tetratricopeptide (TPR) repeat protein
MTVPALHIQNVRTLPGRLAAVSGDERQLAWLASRLAVAVVLLVAVSVGYYLYDHYQVRAESPLDAAARALEDQVRQSPNDPMFRVQVAQAYQRQGRTDLAVAQYAEALRLKADWQPALLGLASADLQRGDDTGAEATYRHIAELNKDSELRYANTDLQEVYYRLGVFAERAGRHAEAAQWAREALNVDRTEADALYLLGQSQEALGQVDAAADAYRQAVSFDPGFREGFTALERVAVALGDGREAGYARAMGQLAAGDLDGALIGFHGLLDQSPQYGEAYQGLGLTYARQGQNDQAIAAFRAALDNKPGLLLAEWSLRSLGAER